MGSLEVISFWYNEEFLAPFFLRSYRFADKITILLDAATDDGTRSVLHQYPTVCVHEIAFPKDGKLNNTIKADALSKFYRLSKADWVLIVDADEFMIPAKPGDAVACEYFDVVFHQVYRHVTDADLDPDTDPFYQRRHGDPNVTSGINGLYVKPVLCRSGLPASWGPGNHSIHPATLKKSETKIIGAHWAMADPCFCIERKLSRAHRYSDHDIKNNMGWHNRGLTAESLRARCAEHLHDPEVF